MKTVLICGAGQIGRGFLGQLLHQSDYRLLFVDADAVLVDALCRARSYRVEIAGAPERSEQVPLADAFNIEESQRLAAAIRDVDLLVSAVGARHIDAAATRLAPHVVERDAHGEHPLDWLICENAVEPATRIRTVLDEHATKALRRVGLIETLILRSGMPPDEGLSAEDPLALRMSDWWTLPADADAFTGELPAIHGLEPRSPFTNELQRKLYTFNGLNGPIAYLGYARGFRYLHEAATAPALEPFLREIHAESAHGLLGEFGGDPAEHRSFQALAWNKYRDPVLADTLERNARDSLRKLGPEERLVGPARLCLKHGRSPTVYATAIAAAIAYDGSADPGTRRVQELLAEGGVREVLRRACELGHDSPLTALVEEAWREWVKGNPPGC
jgi:mannitol-1-phosphate 5-dehydrogenase